AQERVYGGGLVLAGKLGKRVLFGLLGFGTSGPPGRCKHKVTEELTLAWNNIALIMRNKPNIETLNIDDLYNNMKVYKAEIKGESSSGSNSYNVAFVSSENTSSINETATAAYDIPAVGSKEQPSASIYADDVLFSFFVAMITMQVKKFMKRTGRNINFNGKELVGFDKTKVKCYNCHIRGHFASECHAPRNQGNRSVDNERRVVPVETPASALVVQDGLGGYDWSYQAEEGPTDFALMLEETMKEKYYLKEKLTNFEESSKNLTKLINSQMSANDKTGLGYDCQLSENEMPKCEIFEIASDSNVSEIDEDNNQAKDRSSVNENESVAPKSSEEIRDEPKTVSNDNSVKSFESTKKYISENHTNNHDENLRKRQDSRVDWNGMKTQKQGIGFEFNKRACFVCGSVNHLIKDCNFYDNKMVEKYVVNNKGKGTGQREFRPMWNNARRVNHQKFSKMTHPYPKRNFVPTAVATKSGQVLVNDVNQNSAASTSTARPKHNKSFLTEYQEIDGGFVTFGGSPKGVLVDAAEFWLTSLTSTCPDLIATAVGTKFLFG
nr:ribonuclease H-like domain-containing protein [Tanacetum cinerariifolium]